MAPSYFYSYIYAAVATGGGGGSFILFTVSFNDAIHNAVYTLNGNV